MKTPPSLPDRSPAALPASRRWSWLLGIGSSLLLLVVLAGLTQVWHTQRSFDRMVQAALTQQPIVNGHLGELRRIERTATPAEDRRIGGAVSYRLLGDAGTGVASARFVATDAAHLRIDEGVLRSDDGIVYPLTEPSDAPGTTDASAADNDPLRPRVEYLRSRAQEHDYPRVIVDIDSSSRSDLELIQYARRRLIGPLTRIQSVQRIYSMGSRASQPIGLLQLDHARMASLKLSTQDVREALLSNHFQRLPATTTGEIYTWSGSDQDARPVNEIFSSLLVKPTNGPAVPLAQIARVVLTMQAPRQALGLVISATSPADSAAVVTQARAAMASQASPDIQLDAHISSQLRLRLVP